MLFGLLLLFGFLVNGKIGKIFLFGKCKFVILLGKYVFFFMFWVFDVRGLKLCCWEFDKRCLFL